MSRAERVEEADQTGREGKKKTNQEKWVWVLIFASRR